MFTSVTSRVSMENYGCGVQSALLMSSHVYGITATGNMRGKFLLVNFSDI